MGGHIGPGEGGGVPEDSSDVGGHIGPGEGGGGGGPHRAR